MFTIDGITPVVAHGQRVRQRPPPLGADSAAGRRLGLDSWANRLVFAACDLWVIVAAPGGADEGPSAGSGRRGDVLLTGTSFEPAIRARTCR